MNRIVRAVVGLVALVCAAQTMASPIKSTLVVQSTSYVNCNSAPHGLWTGFMLTGECANYFDIDAGTLFTEFYDGTATLTGSATNQFGVTATIDLFLSDFAEVGNYKQGGGVAYDPLTDTPDIDFYQSVSGTITLLGVVHEISLHAFDFQYGIGANAKTNEYGAAAWVNASGYADYHWDLNLAFVPEPTTIALLGLSLAGLGFTRRKYKR